ncbi:MAG: hypothetical protein ACI9FJ_000851 [Alteromonadaceae bacterium]|jgi:hypothetical protein
MSELFLAELSLAGLSLAELQQAFMAELSGQPNDAFRAVVKDNLLAGKMNKATRIDIYHRNHIGARVSGLGNVYPVCQQILGEDAFAHLADVYVASFNSSHWDLNYHGEDFDQFLAEKIQQIASLDALFYLADLARLEWAFHVCYFAPANQPCKVESQDPDKLHFVGDSSVKLLSSELPIFQIWYNNRQDKGDEGVEDTQAVYYHLVYREDLIPQVYNLSATQYALITDCIAGKTLAELAELHGEAVAQNIPTFIEQKWLILAS